MLIDLTIENLGVIPEASAEFSPGLTVLTGETGAGKTMVVTGLRLLAGARADASRVRSGAKQAVVEGRFGVEGASTGTVAAVREILEQSGGSADEGGEYVASRIVSEKGRSRAHLGGRSVPASTLKDFSGKLLTIHGQNDQLRLLGSDEQRGALDRTSQAVLDERAAYRKAYKRWRVLDRDLRRRTEQSRELAQEVDRLQHALEEIDMVGPQPGEDQELVSLIRRLQDVDALRDAASQALMAIDGEDALGAVEADSLGASALLGHAESALLEASTDKVLDQVAQRLSEVISELGELSAELGVYLGRLPSDDAALEEALQRQHELKNLTRKYAPSINEVLAWRDKAQQRLASIDVSAGAIEKLSAQTAEAKKVMLAAADRLSTQRAKAARELEEAVTAELDGLAMRGTEFVVKLTTIAPGPFGRDEVELCLRTRGAGEPRPVASAASGGELSRVMLALEVILADSSPGTTMVFDEVDAGVGGRAAVEIGSRLARLAKKNQVIVVTHLPQVAAFADTHLRVSKYLDETGVTSGVEILDHHERVAELARMLAGLDDTDTGRAHAEELLSRAQNDRD